MSPYRGDRKKRLQNKVKSVSQSKAKDLKLPGVSAFPFGELYPERLVEPNFIFDPSIAKISLDPNKDVYISQPSSIIPSSILDSSVVRFSPDLSQVVRIDQPSYPIPLSYDVMSQYGASIVDGHVALSLKDHISGSPSISLSELTISPMFKELGGSVTGDDVLIGGKSLYDFTPAQIAEELKRLEGKLNESSKNSQEKIEKIEALFSQKMLRAEEVNEEKTRELDEVKISAAQDRLEYEKIKKLLDAYQVGSNSEMTSLVQKIGQVVFDRETGEIFWDGRKKMLGQLEPHSQDYAFFSVLFDGAGRSLPYSVICNKLGRKLRQDGKDDPNFCQAIKAGIKKYAPLVAELVEDYSTFSGGKGYRLICYKSQKKVRIKGRKI